MIKFYCDKCGKEITDNVNTTTEETEVVDGLGNVVHKIRGKTLHICDECQYEELTCGFKVGDKVITADGRTGVIESICDCNSCKERGFYEPTVKMTIGGDQIYITHNAKNNGFISFYQIGNQVFGNIDEEAEGRIRRQIVDLRHQLCEYESQLNMLKGLNK